MANITKVQSVIDSNKRRRSDRSSTETECELSPKRINMYDQQSTSPPSIGSANQQVTLGSTGEIIATSSEILNVRPDPVQIQQSPNQIMNMQIRDGAPALSPNFHQQPQFFLPQFPVPVPPVQNILADIHNKLSKLNCLDDILAKLSNLETRFSNMEKNVHNLAEEVAKCKNNSETLEDTTNTIRTELTKTKDELLELQTRTMRDNLVFFNIPEKQNEKPEDTEQILYEFIEHDMKVDSELTKSISFERVHRSGPVDRQKNRKIVAKFSFHKEREIVRSHSKNLKGTNFFVREQFPTEVIEARKKLYPAFQQAKKNNQRANLVVNKLYIDGKEFKPPNETH